MKKPQPTTINQFETLSMTSEGTLLPAQKFANRLHSTGPADRERIRLIL
jgi:hypothetical protein